MSRLRFSVVLAALTVATTVAVGATASGTFAVELEPQGEPDEASGTTLARTALSKQYAGDLVGTARGEMLTAVTGTPGSAGYVAIERVVGRLAGREGTFVLQHDGTMDRGKPRLSIEVVPDSGTGGLVGLTGSMKIEMADGEHRYVLEYSLPEPR